MTAERDSMTLNEVSVPALGVEERSDEAPRADRARPTPDPEVVAKPQRRQFTANTGFACGTSLTLADITLHGGVGLAVMVMGNHGITDRFEGQPKLAKWWATINANPTLKPALDEIHETVRKFRQQREAEAATKKSAAG